MIDVNTAYQVLSRARKRARRAYLTPAIPDDAPAACQKCAAKTPDYIRGLQGVRAKVDAHVETCSGCRARLAEMLAESSRIKGLFSFAPIGLVVSAKGLIRRVTPTKTPHLVTAGAIGSAVLRGRDARRPGGHPSRVDQFEWSKHGGLEYDQIHSDRTRRW